MKTFTAILAALACTLTGAMAPPVRAAGGDTAEYDVKAVHIFNFTKFVEWPEAAFASPDSPLVIGVLGEDPFGGALAQAVKDEKFRDRSIELRTASKNVEELKGCHIVFVSRSEQANVAKICTALGGSHALVVGDVPDFAERGGVINFYSQGKKVRFEINVKAAQKKGLKISAQLLGIAKSVGRAE